MLGPLPAELVLASRLFGAGLFLLAATGKLRNWTAFIGVVGNYRLLPSGAERAAAGAIVAAEMIVAAGLAIGIPFAGLLGIVLLLGFAAAMAIALLRGDRTIDCGCFQSALRQRLSGLLVLRNLLLAGLLLPSLALSSPVHGAIEIADGVAAAVALLLLNTAIATMLALRDASADLRKRYA